MMWSLTFLLEGEHNAMLGVVSRSAVVSGCKDWERVCATREGILIRHDLARLCASSVRGFSLVFRAGFGERVDIQNREKASAVMVD